MNTPASSLFISSALALAITSACFPTFAFEIEEIVVTAQKREQSLQDVPISVNAFSEDFMARAGVNDVRGLVTLTPGFYGATEDSFTDAMSMRGISTNDYGVGGDPSIPVFVDGVWAGRTGGIQSSFFDMAGAEVVKGPQGTLFGRNAIAGAVSIKTKKPTNESEGYLKVGLGEYDRQEFTATFNQPLTNKLFFRGSVYSLDEDGYLDNLQGGADYGFHKNSAIRLGLRYEGETVDATITASYEDREQNSSIYWDTRNTYPDDKANSNLLGYDAKDEGEISTVTANIEVDLQEGVTLTSITGWKSYNFNYLEDTDATPAFNNHFFLTTETEYMSQEFRINFDLDESLVWFAGVSYYQEDIEAITGTEYDEDQLCIAISQTQTDDFATPITGGCAHPDWVAYFGSAPTPGQVNNNKRESIFEDVDSDGWGVYADFTYSLTEKLDVLYGIRYTEDSKKMSLLHPQVDGYLGNFWILGVVVPEKVSDEETWEELTQRVALNYTLNEEVSFYFNYGQGYKSGGYGTYAIDLVDGNSDGIADAGTKPSSFDPETVDSYEVGVKTKLLENRLQVNLSLYTYDYEDLQYAGSVAGRISMVNVGESSGDGAELDVRFLPAENWDIFLTVSYLDTEVTDDTSIVAAEICGGCEGNTMPFSPEWSIASLTTYRLPLTHGDIFLTAEYFYQDKQYSDLDNLDIISQDSWEEVNFRVGFDSSDNWRLTLWVENIFDEEYFERGWATANEDNTGGFGTPNLQTWTSKPSTIGIDFEMDF